MAILFNSAPIKIKTKIHFRLSHVTKTVNQEPKSFHETVITLSENKYQIKRMFSTVKKLQKFSTLIIYKLFIER